MLHRFRDRFGTAGLIVSIAALILALAGGAYAASGGLNSKQKKEVKSIAKSFQGTGPAGAQGPAGAKGDAGAAGANGKDGTNGTNGTNGKSAETASFAGNQHGCTEGGIEVKSASPVAFVCNGVKGTNGTNGTTGFTETLPSGKTETGTYVGLVRKEGPAAPGIAPVSFPIPLAAPLDGEHVIKVNMGDPVPTECAGGTVNSPKAAQGYLCVFNAGLGGFSQRRLVAIGQPGFGSGASRVGALLQFEIEEEEEGLFFNVVGTYAVTAP
jgi:hypothetical protein